MGNWRKRLVTVLFILSNIHCQEHMTRKFAFTTLTCYDLMRIINFHIKWYMKKLKTNAKNQPSNCHLSEQNVFIEKSIYQIYYFRLNILIEFFFK